MVIAGSVDNVHRTATSIVPAGGSSVPVTSSNTYGSSVWGSAQGMNVLISVEFLFFLNTFLPRRVPVMCQYGLDAEEIKELFTLYLSNKPS